METVYWVGILSALVALVGILVAIEQFNKSQKNKRLDDFENNFSRMYTNDGCVLECLIPAGILNLKNDKEINDALERLKNRLRINPLRTWKDDIEIIGYKKLFQRVVNGPGPLNKNTIQVYINSFKKQ